MSILLLCVCDFCFPDGHGGRCRGYDPDTNKSGDIIYANTPILDKGDGVGVQYFWEAFPAGSGPGDRYKTRVTPLQVYRAPGKGTAGERKRSGGGSVFSFVWLFSTRLLGQAAARGRRTRHMRCAIHTHNMYYIPPFPAETNIAPGFIRLYCRSSKYRIVCCVFRGNFYILFTRLSGQAKCLHRTHSVHRTRQNIPRPQKTPPRKNSIAPRFPFSKLYVRSIRILHTFSVFGRCARLFKPRPAREYHALRPISTFFDLSRG